METATCVVHEPSQWGHEGVTLGLLGLDDLAHNLTSFGIVPSAFRAHIVVHAIILSVDECQMIEGDNLAVWFYLRADWGEEFLRHHVLWVIQLPLEGCQVPPTRKMFILLKQDESLVLNGQLAELGIAELAIPIIVQNIKDTFDLLG